MILVDYDDPFSTGLCIKSDIEALLNDSIQYLTQTPLAK